MHAAEKEATSYAEAWATKVLELAADYAAKCKAAQAAYDASRAADAASQAADAVASNASRAAEEARDALLKLTRGG